MRFHFRPGLLSLGVLVALSGALRADSPPRTHEIAVEDYFSIAVVSACAASPDGRHVAYTDVRWEPPAETRNTELWVVPTAGGSPRRLTFDPAADGNPHWSRDSRFVYFTSARKRGDEKNPPYNGKTQVWRISVEGGEPAAITRLADGVGSFALSADEQTLFYTVSRDEQKDEWKDLRSKFSSVDYASAKWQVTEVWKLDLVSWREEKILDQKRYVRDFAVSEDGRHIAMITTPDDRLISNEGQTRVDVYDVSTKQTTTLPDHLWRSEAKSPFGWLENLAWSDDGNGLAFMCSWDGYPSELYVAEWDDSGLTVRKVDRPAGVDAAGGVRWRPASRDLCFLGESRARKRVYCIRNVAEGGQGEALVLTQGDVVVDAVSFADDGGMAYVMSTPTFPTDVFYSGTGQKADESRRLTNVNPQIDTWKLPHLSLVTWKAPDGTEVEGILELPPDYRKEDGPLPLVVEIHGGPTSSTLFYLQYWIYGRTLLPAKGYALLSPNYRGSTGYGDKFMTDLIGREADIEVQDILSGVDALIQRGIADPKRLGVMGWSNGGFLTNALITQTDRFAAASSGAGVLHQILQWSVQDTPGHNINFMRGLPWEAPDAYRAASPLYKLGNVKTPTLIHVGGDDERVPAVHARALHRALHDYLKVPTELLVYPGQGHGLTKYTFRKAKMEWDLAWFDKYLRGDESKSPTKKEEPAAAQSAGAPGAGG